MERGEAAGEPRKGAKHGLDFRDAEEAFRGFAVVVPDRRFDYGEDRFVRISEVRGRIVTVVYTEQDDEQIRIMSFRRAGPFERRAYEDALANRLDPG